jgi:hypothetical protein
MGKPRPWFDGSEYQKYMGKLTGAFEGGEYQKYMGKPGSVFAATKYQTYMGNLESAGRSDPRIRPVAAGSRSDDALDFTTSRVKRTSQSTGSTAKRKLAEIA